jgi:hypothetical protein
MSKGLEDGDWEYAEESPIELAVYESALIFPVMSLLKSNQLPLFPHLKHWYIPMFLSRFITYIFVTAFL